MRWTTLVQAAAGVRHTSHSFRALTPIAYRTLFYPSGPPPSSASTSDAGFPFEARSHLSAEQFESVRNARGRQVFNKIIFSGLLPEEKPQVALLRNSTPAEVWAQSSNRFADSQQDAPGIHRGGLRFLFYFVTCKTDIYRQDEPSRSGSVTTSDSNTQNYKAYSDPTM